MKKSGGAKSGDGADVGYKRPPAEHQFKKGVSGNPSGRPKRKVAKRAQPVAAPSLEDIIMREAFRTITIRENDQSVEMPMIQAVMRSLGVSAVKGSFRAQLAIADMVRSVEERSLKSRESLFEAVLEYKEAWRVTFAECDRQGISRPDPVPHPDDLVIDSQTAAVLYNGPFDEKEKADWDKLLGRRDAALEEIAYAKKAMKRARSPRMKEFFEDDIRREQKLVDLINGLYPSPEVRRKPNFDLRKWREEQKGLKAFRESMRASRTTVDDSSHAEE